MNRRYLVSMLCAVLFGITALAQGVPEIHFVLVPLTVSDQPGANGSRWVVETFVRNVGSNVDRWGTALPIARYEDFRRGPVRVRPVPNTGEHRLSVRRYSWPNTVESLVIELWRLDPTTLDPLERLSAVVAPPAPNPYGYTGAVYETHNLFAGLEASVGQQFELRVVPPRSEELPVFWGSASVTNNETQHVTIFKP